MKILHTSDWHLGQIFMGRSRESEHREFLEWLLKLIKEENIDLLIVAGDIFDTASPPVYAQKLYYDFLYRLSMTSCKKSIITAGNHDSVSVLNAPKDLLSLFNIDVVTEEGKIIEFEDILICAVPYLRERVILRFVSSQTYKESESALIKGIKEHYDSLYKEAKKRNKNSIIIATGHLSVLNSATSGSEKEIYIGNLSTIESGFFSKRFDYTALGHLHKAQKAGSDKVRYSGCVIPLSFNEAKYDKSVLLTEIKNKKIETKEIKIPVFRKLLSIKSSPKEIEEKLKKLKDTKNIWCEVIIQGDEKGEFVYKEIIENAQKYDTDILAVKYEKDEIKPLSSSEIEYELESITPLKVFEKRLENEDFEDEKLKNSLVTLFKKVLNQTEFGEEMI